MEVRWEFWLKRIATVVGLSAVFWMVGLMVGEEEEGTLSSNKYAGGYNKVRGGGSKVSQSSLMTTFTGSEQAFTTIGVPTRLTMLAKVDTGVGRPASLIPMTA